MQNSNFLWLIVLLLVCLLPATPGLGQATTGTIVGTVMDPSMASIAGAQVEVASTRTGTSRTVTTNETGGYTVPGLLPAEYKITVTASGFKRVVVDSVTLRVDQELRRDVVMQVGEATQEITVTADTVAVGTETPALGTVIATQQVLEMPLNGRSFIQLAALSAGVASPGTAQGASVSTAFGRRPSVAISISGQREATADYRFDGIPSKDRVYGPVGMQMDVDSIAEFNIQRGYNPAAIGVSGRINVATKSGTNQLHGSAWEFLRNDVFDARNTFALSKPPYRQNQYGASAGGPIIKNKLFVFGDYEGLNTRRSSPALGTVPTPEMLQGNFVGLSPVIDPSTGAPFPGNIVPSARISKYAKTVNPYFLPPNASGAANLRRSVRFKQDDDKYNVRVDYTHSASDTFFGRYTHVNSEIVTEALFPTANNGAPLRSRNAVVSWTHVFSPNLLNNFKVGLNRVLNFPATPADAATNPNFPKELGLTNLLDLSSCNQLPSNTILGFTAPSGIGNCIALTNQDIHFINELSYTRGRHRVSAGTEVMKVFMRQFVGNWGSGSFNFTNQYTGNSVADYLLGIPANATGGNYARIPDRRGVWPSFFVDDQIRITSKLNLSLGLRWSYFQPLAEDQNKLVSFDPTIPGGGFLYEPGSGLENFGRIGPPGLAYPDKNDWAPRIGLAYSPSENTAIRASYGIFYQEMGGNRLNLQQTGPPFVLTTSIVGDPKTPTIHIDTDGLFPKQTPPYQGLSPFGNDPVARTPYLQTWTFSVQRTLPGSLFLEAAYVGSKGTKLDKLDDLNIAATPPPPGFTGTLQSRRPFPNYGFILFGANKGTSSYNSLQMSLRKQLSHGLSFLGSYTYSKSLDTDSFDSKACRCYVTGHPGKARSEFDERQRFVFSWSYELPFKPQSSVVKSVLGGWQVTGITTLQSGFPFTVRTSRDYSNRSSTFNQLPNRTCDGNLPTGQRKPEKWFDTSCFSAPALNTVGNSGWQILDTDGLINQDLGLLKNFALRESLNLQFRAETFNLFNHTNFGVPGSILENPTFGVVLSSLPQRIIQFGLRLGW